MKSQVETRDRRRARIVLVAMLLTLGACSDGRESEPTGEAGTSEVAPIADAASVDIATDGARAVARRAALVRGARDELSLANLSVMHEPAFGDFDAIEERRTLRALVPYSKTFYFLDGGTQRGLAYESLKQFETEINEKLGSGHLRVYVVIVPVTRDELISGLVDGYGDIAVGNITITEGRREHVDFSDPLLGGVNEVIVTGPGALEEESPPMLEALDDLSGRAVAVRASSSYHASLERLNTRFRAEGKEPVRIELADELLEDEDLLEMVNAGLVPIVVVDKHKAVFWAQIFSEIVVRDDLVLSSGGEIAWAFRKDSPLMAEVVNDFVRTHKRGTLMGNVLFNRYLKSTKWAERALTEQGRARFKDTADLFRQYSAQYDFPWLLVTAQAYQESRLDQSMRSSAGAVGVMQMLPSTAADPNVAIDGIENLESNIHAGVKYLRFIYDRYFSEADMDELNKSLFSFAAYNAGPARVAQLRRQAEEMGFDPNIWFRNVEVVAAREIGRETVQYVSNIFKYYIAYQRSVAMEQARGRSG